MKAVFEEAAREVTLCDRLTTSLLYAQEFAEYETEILAAKRLTLELVSFDTVALAAVEGEYGWFPIAFFEATA